MGPKRRIALVIAGTLAVVGIPALAKAATITVACTPQALINAINAANSTAAADTLQLGSCVYRFTSADNTGTVGANALPIITTPITMKGNGSTLQRDAAATDDFRLIEVGPTGSLTADSLTIRDGFLEGDDVSGGGLLNRGTTSLKSVRVLSNEVDAGDFGSSTGFGGGIANSGALTITSGIIEDNEASAGAFGFATGAGGGVANSGTLSITSAQIRYNELSAGAFIEGAAFGGGVGSGNGGTATLTQTQVVGNTVIAEAFGLAVAVGGGVSGDGLTLNGTQVLNNRADASAFGAGAFGGGVATLGAIDVVGSSSVQGNRVDANGLASAGGIAVGEDGNVRIANSTVSDNVVESDNTARGGGITNAGNLNLVDAVVRRNRASGSPGLGGGLFNTSTGTATIQGSQIRSNTASTDGGGIYNAAAVGAVTISGTQVSSNTPNNCAPPGSVPGCTG